MKIFNLKNFFIVAVMTICLSYNPSSGESQVSIILKVEDRIITNLDLENEIKYLIVLNNDLKRLNNKQLKKIAKDSLIKENIKRKELEIYFDLTQFDDTLLVEIIESIYTKLKIDNITDFIKYLKNNDLEFKDIKNKIMIEVLWNQLIFGKYENSLQIDEIKIKNTLKNELKEKETIKNYYLYEILFNVEKKDDIKKKYDSIKQSILDKGFKNTATIYSKSNSATSGGEIGWIKENQVSKLILSNLKDLKINEITDPIQTSNGLLILKVDKIKEEEINFDIDKEVKKIILIQKNKQLNDFSRIYYYRIKNNTNINEY
jgi:peptidyl-prolyl cis-trans isomerase SurA